MHKTVLLDEVIGFLLPEPNKIYVDATLGSGGHSEKILEKSAPSGKLIGIDIDPLMLCKAKERLARFGERVFLFESNYVNLIRILDANNIDKVDGIVFDLGVSTEHFFESERGFSVIKDGPLDMRLSSGLVVSAKEIINKWDAGDLLKILYKYGEEEKAKKIVGNILKQRDKKNIETTKELVEIVVKSVGVRRGEKIHPATKTFQALRIAVNDELNNIKKVLPFAIQRLKKGARLCVISFHSLEDRIVKDVFREMANPCNCPIELGRCICGKTPVLKIICKKPVVPDQNEILCNPRARSAKLRVAEKIL